MLPKGVNGERGGDSSGEPRGCDSISELIELSLANVVVVTDMIITYTIRPREQRMYSFALLMTCSSDSLQATSITKKGYVMKLETCIRLSNAYGDAFPFE